MSSCPVSAHACLRRLRTAAASFTSQLRYVRPSTGSPSICLERAKPVTVPPAPASPRAIAAPMPRDAPPTSATLPSSENRRSGSDGSVEAIAVHDRGGEREVFRTVYLKELVLRHDIEADLSAEAVVMLAQKLGREYVEGAVFQIPLFDLLTTLACRRVVVYAASAPRGIDPPDEEILDLAHREQRIETFALVLLDSAIEIRALAQWRRGLHADHPPDRDAVGLYMVDGVQPGRFRAGFVPGDQRRAHDRPRTVALGHRKDLGVIGAHPDRVDSPRRAGLQDRPGEQRLAAEVDQILPRNALRAASRGNDGDRRCHRAQAPWLFLRRIHRALEGIGFPPQVRPQLLRDGKLLGVHLQRAAAERLADLAHCAHHLAEAGRLHRRRLIRTVHRPAESDVPLKRRGAQGNRRIRDGEADLVAAVADVALVALAQFDEAQQIRVLVGHRVGGDAVHELERTLPFAKDLHRAVDVRDAAHAGGNEGVFALARYLLQQLLVHDHGRGDLVVTQVELAQEFLAFQVPRGGEPLDAFRLAVAADLLVVVQVELETFLLRALGVAPRAFARRVQKFSRVNEVQRALLELDRIGAGIRRNVDQLPGDVEVAIVVDADFSDDEQAHRSIPVSFQQHSAGARRKASRSRRRRAAAASSRRVPSPSDGRPREPPRSRRRQPAPGRSDRCRGTPRLGTPTRRAENAAPNKRPCSLSCRRYCSGTRA